MSAFFTLMETLLILFMGRGGSVVGGFTFGRLQV